MSRTFLLAIICAFACSPRPLAAQCTSEWHSGGPVPEVMGFANCSTLWDPDGAGPLPQRLVVGGSLMVGGMSANHLVTTWDGSEWQALAPGLHGNVEALVTWNGLLVAGGDLPSIGGNIAGWNGASWLPLGPGVPFVVDALTVWNGNLVAVGERTVGSNTVADVRLWDGVAWTALPATPVLDTPSCAVTYQGQLCVAGRGAGTTGVLERWNGSTWAPAITTGGTGNTEIHCMAVRPSLAVGVPDTLYVGGAFTSIGGTTASRIAATSGGALFAWSPIGTGLTSPCIALIARNSGLTNLTLVAATASTTAPLMRYTGSSSSWSAMGTAQARALAFWNGAYYCITGFQYSAGEAACLTWNGTAWVPVRGPGFVGEVRALALSGANTVVGGVFASIDGVTTNHVAAWNGTTFSPLGTGVTGSSVDALLTLDNGHVVAGGAFTTAGGITANNLARWNGSAWSAFGTGLDQQVLAICEMPNGDLIVGGSFTTAGGVACARIARWNGSAWSPLGSGMNGDVRALAVRTGTLFAAGSFTLAGGQTCSRIAQWNGSNWLPLAAGCNSTVHGLAVRPNGDVVVAGTFTSAGGFPAKYCARWVGIGWAPMGSGSIDPTGVRAICALPNGDVIAGRGFHEPNDDPDSGVSRWNGTAWGGVSGGLRHFQFGRVEVRAFALRPDGALIVGGEFSTANAYDIASRDLAVLSTTCPATAQSYGTGCSSAAGPLVTTVDALPWIGATFRTKTTGVAANSLCLGLIGLSQVSIPLGSLLPEGQPGCSLLTSLDIMGLTFPVGSVARSEFALALDPALIGVTFHQQAVLFEIDGSGAIVAIRGANGITATIGSL